MEQTCDNSSPELNGCSRALSTLSSSILRCRRKLPFFIEPILVLYFFCEFPIDAINQRYTLDWIGKNLIPKDGENATSGSGEDESTCSMNSSATANSHQNRVQSLASWFGIFESITWGLPAIVICLLLGAGSDRYGRRFAIVPPLFGAVCSSVASFAIVHFEGPIIWFLVRDLAYGCCGSFSTMTAACFGYITDRTPIERRMIRLTVVQMAMLMSGVVSPIGLGLLVDRIGYSNCLLIVVCLSSINFIYVVTLMPSDLDEKTTTKIEEPEVNNVRPSTVHSGASRAISADSGCLVGQSECGGASPYDDGGDDALINPSDENVLLAARQSQHHRDCDPSTTSTAMALNPSATADQPPCFYSCCNSLVDGIRRIVGLFFLQTSDGRRWKMCTLIVVFFISTLPTYNFSVQTLFAMNHPLCWSLSQVGFFTGVSLGVSTVGGLITAPLLERCLSDAVVAIWAALTCVLTSVFKGFVVNTAMMYISTSLNMFNILLIPSVRAMMSGLVGDQEQGAVFGAIASVEVLCSVLGTVIFNSVYSSTLDISTGFVFFVMAAFYAVGCLMLFVYTVRVFLEKRPTRDNNTTDPPLSEDQERALVVSA